MTTANKVIKYALSQVGTEEYPPGSNCVKYNTAYYGHKVKGSAYAWCSVFVWYCFKKSGASKLFCNGKKVSYVPTVKKLMKSRLVKTGRRGDLVLFDFNSNGTPDHIGFVLKHNSDGSYTTIEGNTSVTSNDNGGKVMKRKRWRSQINCFIRPKYYVPVSAYPDLKYGKKGAYVKKAQIILSKLGYKVKADGVFGKKTQAAVKRFQKINGLKVDGVIGQKTWKVIAKKWKIYKKAH